MVNRLNLKTLHLVFFLIKIYINPFNLIVILFIIDLKQEVL